MQLRLSFVIDFSSDLCCLQLVTVKFRLVFRRNVQLKNGTLESGKIKQSTKINVPDLNGLQQVDCKLRLTYADHVYQKSHIWSPRNMTTVSWICGKSVQLGDQFLFELVLCLRNLTVEFLFQYIRGGILDGIFFV
jgi:hypothetical protein